MTDAEGLGDPWALRRTKTQHETKERAMDIEISVPGSKERYRLHGHAHGWDTQVFRAPTEAALEKDPKAKGNWVTLSYYARPEQALAGLANLKIRTAEVYDLVEAVRYVNDLAKELGRQLEMVR